MKILFSVFSLWSFGVGRGDLAVFVELTPANRFRQNLLRALYHAVLVSWRVTPFVGRHCHAREASYRGCGLQRVVLAHEALQYHDRDRNFIGNLPFSTCRQCYEPAVPAALGREFQPRRCSLVLQPLLRGVLCCVGSRELLPATRDCGVACSCPEQHVANGEPAQGMLDLWPQRLTVTSDG